MPDPHNLRRFIDAQAPLIATVRAELAAGQKRTHWMWFVFPQLAGLGSSPTARHYALASRAEAQAYMANPVLGQRLVDCTDLVNAVRDRTIHRILGSPDDLKFHSCMTLFHEVAPECPVFAAALERHFSSNPDPRTVALLGAPAKS